MSETTSSPTPSEKPVFYAPNLGRLWTLTYVSLGLNGLILLLIVIGAVMHPRGPGRFADRGDRGGCPFCMAGPRGGGFDRGFDRGGPGPRGFGWNRFDRGGPGDGFGGGPGMMGRGPDFGPGGLRDGGPKGPPDPAKMTDMILDRLTQTLTLTDDQKAKIKPIIADQVAQMQKDMEAQKQARQKQFEDGKAKIKPLLNADQQKQLDALPMPGQRPPPPPPSDDPGQELDPDAPPGQ